MHQATLSDVQIINLTLLMTIHDSVRADGPAACCRFGLDAVQAGRIGAMSVPQMMALVANLGDESLFPARPDLVALIDAPLPLARPLAAVHGVGPKA